MSGHIDVTSATVSARQLGRGRGILLGEDRVDALLELAPRLRIAFAPVNAS